ncbi:sensor histidine kinase [Paenibacillus contaminans]|uniref:Sensor histidine kinase n=1 Tax=Paenibacillus contaminans TaxID=450362 RepID=A0A329MM34_9BACL|nr:sensor histidine kinase [Paenibacillus contaminans]RAV20824.1 sensor histidine kinase [Paenibacillus contaminans]
MRRKDGKRFVSLQYKILFFTVILVLIPLLVVGILSYVKSSEIIRQKVSVSDLNTVTQIGQNLEFMFEYFHDTSLFVMQSGEVRQFLRMNVEADPAAYNGQKLITEQLLTNLPNMKAFVQSIQLQGMNGSRLNVRGAVRPLQTEQIAGILARKGEPLWYLNEIVLGNGAKKKVISYERAIKDINNISVTLGVLQMNMDLDAVSSLFESRQSGGTDHFYLLNERNAIVASTDGNSVSGSISDIIGAQPALEQHQGYRELTIDRTPYLLTYDQIEQLPWHILHLVPAKELLKENQVIPQIIVITTIISFFVCAGMAYLFSRQIILPIRKLRRLMSQVEGEDFTVRIAASGNDEIAQLGQSFNHMLERLREMIREVYTAQIHKKEAELKAFQAQINPHFLYNTLDTIYWMSRMEKAFETSELVQALSKLFRLSLNSGKELTTVRAEVEHIRHYVVIQQKRYEDSIDFQIEVEEEALDCQTVKLVIQPFVENAIIHGIEKKGDSGVIRVDIKREDDRLVYYISDTGYGVDLEEVEQLMRETGSDNKGFAVKNINDRIQLYFGKTYGVEFMNGKEGTVVKVIQPWTKGENEDDQAFDRR